MQNKWNNRKLIGETDKLTKAAERHDLKPIWGYQKPQENKHPETHNTQQRRRRRRAKYKRSNDAMGKMDNETVPNNTGNRAPRNTTHSRSHMEPNTNTATSYTKNTNHTSRKENKHTERPPIYDHTHHCKRHKTDIRKYAKCSPDHTHRKKSKCNKKSKTEKNSE